MKAPSSFWLNLRFWSFHVTLNAAPSFIIACALAGEDWGRRVAGMVPGVLCFIVGYNFLTISPWFHRRVGGDPFAIALKSATRLRSGLAVIGIIGAVGWIPSFKLPSLTILSALEFYAGFFASRVVEVIGSLPFIRNLWIFLTSDLPGERAKSLWLGDMDSIIPTFFTTIIEGLTLSVIMFLIAVIIFITTRAKQRRGQNK